MMFPKTKLSIAIAATATLTGCGGGGGGPQTRPGDNTPTYVRSSVPYATPTRASNFDPLAGAAVTAAMVSDIFVEDLNNDSVDEVVIGGRKTQPSTVADWRSSNLQIYGWNTGSFAQETSSWFAGNDNTILGTEPSIKFGDFDGDGNQDMLVAPGTDMAYYDDAYVFHNTGSSSFTRSDISFSNVWGHDSVVTDLNSDGRDDFVISSLNTNTMAVAFGNADGTFTTYQPAAGSGTTASSGISVADYLGDGTKTMVLTDATATGNQDTKLYSWSVASGNMVLTEVAALPADRFYLSKWDAARAATGIAPHAIRNMTFDFSGDGTPDIVVVSTLPSSGDDPYTEVQFLRNDGAGTFTDVTDSVLINFNTDSAPSYQPRLIDVNQDGLTDIFLSASDYVTDSSAYDSSRVLVATTDGKYVERYASVFRDFWNQISASTTDAHDQWGQPVNIVAGPNNDYYLVGTVLYNDSGDTKTAVYASRILSNGTTSAQSAAAALSTAWPYLSDVSINTTLANTATSFVDGIPVINLNNLFRPYGNFGISLNGRTGTIIPINGTLAVNGLDTTVLENISAVDSLARDFTVNLSGMVADRTIVPAERVRTNKRDSWAASMANINMNYSDDAKSGVRDNQNYSMGYDYSVNKDVTVGFTYTHTDSNPWIDMSGMWGDVIGSDTVDVNVTYEYKNAWVQAGAMNTNSRFEPGLVTDIADIRSVYATAGYSKDELGFYAGIKPYIVNGSVTMNLPTSVDFDGTMYYNSVSAKIKSKLESYVGVSHYYEKHNHKTAFVGVVDSDGDAHLGFNYRYKF